MNARPGSAPAFWSPGDWNAYFGFGTNILVNLLTLTALLRFVLKMPDALVFGRISGEQAATNHSGERS